MENGYLTKGQEVTFVRKTLEILDQYERLMDVLKPIDRHEVTLYINCLLGLLIIPQQSILKGDNRTVSDENEEEWGINLNLIGYCPNKTCPKDSRGSVKEIARHLRNSIGHNRFTIHCHDNVNITNILFKDFADRNGTTVQTFEYDFTIPDVLKFIRNYYKPLLA